MEEREQNANIIKIQGYSVCFPEGRKPFAPQLALMSKLLLGVRKGANCLLESPTGTGKTLALLCATLAWQKRQKETGMSLEESDSEEEGMIVEKSEAEEPRRPFHEFRYVPNTNGRADSTHGKITSGFAKGAVELAYDDDSMPSSRKVQIEQDEMLGWLDEEEENVFHSPVKKRPKTHESKPQEEAQGVASDHGAARQPFGEQSDVRHDRMSVHDEASQRSPSLNSSSESVSGHFAARDPAVGSLSPHHANPKVVTKPTPAGSNENGTARKKKMRRRVPKVYFCSRTHSQLNQVIAELKTCEASFRNTSTVGLGEDGRPFSMTLLASRKSTCINKRACKDPKGVDDACKRLLKDKACLYQRRSKWGQTKLPPVWDVEEAVQLGKEIQTCPYYTARDALTTADLVLCPYNYLVDPGVREIMGINLKGAVVIFDEAHNLEDSAREAASAKLSLRALCSASDEMQRLGANLSSMSPAYALLREVTRGVQGFLEEAEGGLSVDGYEKAHKMYRGEEALGLMQSRAGITAESLVHLKEALNLVMSEDPMSDSHAEEEGLVGGTSQVNEGEGVTDVLSSGSLRVVVSLIKVLGFLLAEDMAHVEHYKMVVLRERAMSEQSSPAVRRGRGGRGRNKNGRGGGGYRGGDAFGVMETYLCFWCQSAGVCFSDIDRQVHSIVLTSGTLSPLDSFAGELGIEFEHRLEAPHVINVAKQCLVTSVGYFGGVSLDSRYTNQHDLKYQDSLGSALLQYARLVPGGILTFFPSYGLMEKMHERWKATGLLQALEDIKAVLLEPRGQGKIEGVLSDYYEAIEAGREYGGHDEGTAELGQPRRRTGALMLAVARGKVSEGIDFSDDAARMCVIVGIPYPSSKDLQVSLKKEYQNYRRQKNPLLVGGSAWYNLQAFRAVNQAVGRCIRHRNDFGAIVLCDPRYSSQPDATASLSKWVRSSVKHCRTVEASLQQVQTFFQQHHTASQSLGTAATNVTPARRPPAPVVGEAVASDCGGVNSARGCKGSGDGCRGATRGDCRRQDPDSAVAISRKGSPGSALVQQTLLQAFRAHSLHHTTADQSTNGRTASPKEAPRMARHQTAAPPLTVDDFSEPATIPDTIHAVENRRDGRPAFYCRDGIAQNPHALASEAVGSFDGEATRPRRVTVRGGCHLYSVATASKFEGGESWNNEADLLEAPRGWTLGEHVSEGCGQWVAKDGLVYAPLFCEGKGGDLMHVGEKALGAGLGGEDLVGRAWFFPRVVDTVGVDTSRTQQKLVLPTYVPPLDSTRVEHLA